MRFRFRYALTGLAGVLLLAAAGSVFRAHDALGIEESELAALESDSEVLVSQDEFIVFQPAEGIPGTGLIFYPGDRVDYRSYAPALHEIAGRGYLVVLIPALLNWMVFDPNAAEAVFSEFPQIAYWPVGGQSLGGAMAADFLHTHPDAAAGLVLWASYPASSNDLSDSGLCCGCFQFTRRWIWPARNPLIAPGGCFQRIPPGSSFQAATLPSSAITVFNPVITRQTSARLTGRHRL